ncbi:Oidioi.mRNA.OKI2018_I69.PAR.g12770.t1.cds [Oikopleura dioica]|uniref:Oidioi.mRNA.OKI2018_I69.PAR.g12770.t1.cds n=1 Tax=Oikopleura dioica TaxID=34765 RepID=A0ABN7S6E2_OIKDI|nr:Oidioi.mRNA.OKI2018_I69.PAR.g12770.t1.cds [Oikopleura dioica]
MPKARKTGNKCVTKMLRKAVTEPPKDNAPLKPTYDRAPIVKKEPVIDLTVDDSPGPSRSTTPIPREQSTTSTLNGVLNDVSFATGARRLYGMAQALLQEDAETTPAAKKATKSSKTDKKTDETRRTSASPKPASVLPKPKLTKNKTSREKEEKTVKFAGNETPVAERNASINEPSTSAATPIFNTSDAPRSAKRPKSAKRNSIKAVRMQAEPQPVEVINPRAKDRRTQQKKRAAEDDQKPSKKKQKTGKTTTKGFMNDPSILSKRRRNEKAAKAIQEEEASTSDQSYNDPDREWEVEHVGGLCLEWEKTKSRRRVGERVVIKEKWVLKPESELRIWIKWKDPFRDNGSLWSAEVQGNLVGVDRELIERSLRRKKCFPMPNKDDGLPDWEDRYAEAFLSGYTPWTAPKTLCKADDSAEVQFIPAQA